MDSTLYLKDYPELLQTADNPELLKDARYELSLNKDEGEFKITVAGSFDQIENVPKTLQESASLLEQINNKDGREDSEELEYITASMISMVLGTDNPKSDYWQLKKNLIYIANPPGFLDEMNETLNIEEAGLNDLDFMNMILGSINYKTEIVLPAKIKSSTFKKSVIDENSIRIQYDLSDLSEDPNIAVGEIKLKMPKAWKKKLKE